MQISKKSVREKLSFQDTIDKDLLNLIIKAGFFITLFLAALVYYFGFERYCLYNLFTAGLCAIAYLLNLRGYFQFAFWFGCVSISLLMVVYTYEFGYINAHLYLIAGMVTLSYFIGQKKKALLVWVLAASLFVFANFLLRYTGRIQELNDLESILFYPNAVLSMVLLYMSNSLYRTKQEQQRIELSDSLLIKNKLLSVLSHDLRTPFHNLNGIIDLMESEGLSEAQKKDVLAKVKTNVNQSYAMLEDILQWISSAEKPLQTNKVNISLKELCDENISFFDTSAKSKEIELLGDFPENTTLCLTDRDKLNTIIRNLLSNALKFTPEKTGKVQLVLKETDAHHIISVTDNGVGMDKSTTEALFSQNTSKMGTSNEKGFGIGLQLVNTFSKELNVSIKVNSEPGKGTKVALHIPKQ